MIRETLKEFEERYEISDANYLSAKHIYNTYYDRIFPYKHLITKHQVTNGITINEICISFGVSKSTFTLCRKYFSELDELVKHKKDVMKIKSEMDLQRGIEDSPSNPKLLEMQFRLYNDEWRDKANQVDLVLPETIKIDIYDDSLNEEELGEYDPKKIEK